MSSINFTPDTTADDVAELMSNNIRGKTILVTGVSPGSLGSEVVKVISRHSPKLIILAGRDTHKLDQTRNIVLKETPNASLRLLMLDLSSLEQVRKAAAEVNEYQESIDVLFNNAGIMAAPYNMTCDGFESQFGINHLAPFLFTNLIMPRLLATPHGSRVIVVSSDGHALQTIRFEDPNWTEPGSYNKWRAYGQAKTANILFAKALADKLNHRGLTAFSLHPGIIQTNLIRHASGQDWSDLMILKKEISSNASKLGRESTNSITNLKAEGPGFGYKSLQQGTATHIIAAFDPSIADQSGEYLQDCQVDPRAREPFAIDAASASKLWALSEILVGQTFSY